MESTLEKIASCRYKTKMDNPSGFRQVDLAPHAQELLAFITPQGRVFKWKVMPFGVANTPALFQELKNISCLSYVGDLWYKNPLMHAKIRHDYPKKGLRDVRSFIGACNFYRRHIQNLIYTSAIVTDLIQKSTTRHWGPQKQHAFDELKDKVADAKWLGMPRAQGEIILVTDASNVGGGGTLFEWQALEKEEFNSAISQ